MRVHAKNLISICGHLGTHKFNWQPESERFAIGYRSSILIYNLANSSFYLNRALNFVEKLIFKYGRTYVYGLHYERDKKWIKKFSFINQVVATETWRGGYVTNARTFRGKVKNIKKRFAAVISFSYDYQNYSLPREAHVMNIPAVCVVDSNVRAENFAYPIPINSTSIGGMRMLAYTFGLYIFKGLSKRIVSRFSKKKKVIKVKNKKKRSILKSKYFKKIRKLLQNKKVKAKRKLQKWIKKFRKIKYKERREARFIKQKKLFRQNKTKRKKRVYIKLKKTRVTKKKKMVNLQTTSVYNKKKNKKNKNKKFHRAQNKKFKRRYNIHNKRKKFRRTSKMSRFSRIRQKLNQLKKMKLFQKIFKTSKKHKTSRFFFRSFKKTVTAYKYVNIYSFLRGKKNKLLKLKNLKKRRQRLYQKKKQEKNKKRYRYFYYNNMFIKKLKKKKSYFPML